MQLKVRSNHDRLVRLSGETQTEKDNPLKLRSTSAWASQGEKIASKAAPKPLVLVEDSDMRVCMCGQSMHVHIYSGLCYTYIVRLLV